jgi:hypothetical protein
VLQRSGCRLYHQPWWRKQRHAVTAAYYAWFSSSRQRDFGDRFASACFLREMVHPLTSFYFARVERSADNAVHLFVLSTKCLSLGLVSCGRISHLAYIILFAE